MGVYSSVGLCAQVRGLPSTALSTPSAATRPTRAYAASQGLTLVHFSVKPEPFLTLKTSPTAQNTPSDTHHQYPTNSP